MCPHTLHTLGSHTLTCHAPVCRKTHMHNQWSLINLSLVSGVLLLLPVNYATHKIYIASHRALHQNDVD